MPGTEASASPEDIANLTLSMANSMALLTQRNCIQYAAASIPVFDGETPALSVFAQNVENGLALIPPNTEPEYLTIVLTKLTGPARISIRDKSFSDTSELLKYLKKRYAPGRNLAHFQGEIARLKIRNDESLRRYIDRVSHLAHRSRAAIRDRYGANADEITKEMDKDILENFIEGLPERVAWRMAALGQKHKDLDEAIEAVLLVDRRLRNRRETHDDRSIDYDDEYRGRRRSRERDHGPRPLYPQSPSPSRYRRQYFRDRSASGSENEYEDRPKRVTAMTLRRSDSRSPSYNSDASEQGNYRDRKYTGRNSDRQELYCWNCGVKGHDGKSCRERSRFQRRTRSPITSSAGPSKSLNFEDAHRNGDPVSVLKKDRPKTIRFTDEKNEDYSKRRQYRESELTSQNWKTDKGSFS